MNDNLHPLQPLTAGEITQAADILRSAGKVGPRMRFVAIVLHEPSKASVAAFETGEAHAPARQAWVNLLDNSDGTVYEVIVSLNDGSIVEWKHIEGVQPMILAEEAAECELVIRTDPAFRAALAKRGLEDKTDLLTVEPWPAGTAWGAEHGNRRLTHALVFVRGEPGDNPFARPLEGLTALIDLNEGVVVHVEDNGIVPLPPESGNYAAHYQSEFRDDIKPLEIVQPEGPSFAIDGSHVRWQKWDFRVGWTPREGLVLHQIGYTDGGRRRPILYRASLCEMIVPYGDPTPSHYRKTAFDVGEYGIGALANSLTLGCDCLGHIHYFDAVMADATGAPKLLKNAVCLHEEDHGILWKHTDWRINEVEVRRSRRLVVSFIATVGNYEYAFYWHLYQDGTIEAEVKLTGILATGALMPGQTSPYGTLVAPQLYAPSHQHFFSFRLDMSVDGEENSVYETNTEPVPPGPDNLYGNAFVHERTLLATELSARSTTNAASARSWAIANPNVTNRLGQPVAYTLEPGGNVLPFAQPDAAVFRRAPFLTRHLFVTPFSPNERFAAGDYPNQRQHAEDGLMHWTEADRSIDNTDIVVWYTMGHHHIPRPEDWPVMPCATIGFKLKPNGFFDRNPALDVPPSAAKGEGSCCASE